MSSSGHLVLLQHQFGLRESELFFDVAVHVGTIMAVLLVFRRDLLTIFRDCLAVLSNLRPTRALPAQNEPREGASMVWMLVVGSVPTAVIGLLFKDIFERLFVSPAGVGVGLWTTGLLRELRSESALRFSFLLSIPAIVGVSFLQLYQG